MTEPNADQATPAVTGDNQPEVTTQDVVTMPRDAFNARLEAAKRAAAAQFSDYEQLKAAAAKLAEIEAESLTQQEKLAQQNSELAARASEAEAKAKRALIRSAVIAEASKANMLRPDIAVRLIDESMLTVTDDTVSGAAEAVAALIAEMPELTKRQPQIVPPVNPDSTDQTSVAGRTDKDRENDYFGGGSDPLWGNARIVDR